MVVTAAMELKTNKHTNNTCSFEEKGKTSLDNTLKSGDITLLTKVYTVKAVVFPVVTYTDVRVVL